MGKEIRISTVNTVLDYNQSAFKNMATVVKGFVLNREYGDNIDGLANLMTDADNTGMEFSTSTCNEITFKNSDDSTFTAVIGQGEDLVELIEDQGNRKLLKQLMEGKSFIDTFEILKTASIATADKREKLYAGVTNVNGETIFSYIGQSANNGPEIIPENPIPNKISSLFHNHYAGSSDAGNLLPTFSGADIANIFSLAKSNSIQDIDDFNLLLVTPQQDLQALMITDTEKFNDRLNVFGNNTDGLIFLLDNEFKNGDNSIQVGINSDKAASSLNDILSDYGLSVYQYNETLDKWLKP